MIRECVSSYIDGDTSSSLGRLLQESILTELNEAIDFDELDNETALLSLLVTSGYLKADKVPSSLYYEVGIPNEETRRAFNDEIILKMKKNNKLDLLMKFRRSLLNGEEGDVGTYLSKCVLDFFSYLDLTNEKSYQIIINTFMPLLFDDFVLDSEYASGNGIIKTFI